MKNPIIRLPKPGFSALATSFLLLFSMMWLQGGVFAGPAWAGDTQMQAASASGGPGLSGFDLSPKLALSTHESAPTLPAGSHSVGALSSDKSIGFQLVLSPRDPAALASFIQSLYQPSSPNYHHFLTPSEYYSLFGPTQTDLNTLSASLGSFGIQLQAKPSDLVISATGTAAEISRAFGTGFESVKMAGGRIAYANTKAPKISAADYPIVSAVTGLDDLRPMTYSISHNKAAGPGQSSNSVGSRTTSAPTPCASAQAAEASIGGYTYDQIAGAYGFDTAYQAGNFGSYSTVALFEMESYLPSDISSFEHCYGISTSVTNEIVDGGAGSGPGGGEAVLDIDNVIALAPAAHVIVYEAPNPAGYIDEWKQIVDDNKAKSVSTSWGGCEASDIGNGEVSAENTLFTQAAAQGQSIFAASGDSGSSDCYTASDPSATQLAVDDPGSQPYVTDVGGTSMTNLGSPPVEVAWNNQQGGAGGGGISRNWPMQSWQTGPGVVNSYSSNSECGAKSGYCREVPDVSADADPNNGYLDLYAGNWNATGGTSAAAPLWAALAALDDSACSTPIGFANPKLYSLAASGPGYLNDVIKGNNDMLGTNNGAYPATTGYDMATGLGTPTSALFKSNVMCPAGTPPPPSPPSSTCHVSGVSYPIAAMASDPSEPGYWIADVGGNVAYCGGATALSSSTPSAIYGHPIIGVASLPNGTGLWAASSDGSVFSYGSALSYGSMYGAPLSRPIVGIASTPDGNGYWLVASDGGIFAFGDAQFYGSTGNLVLNRPIVGIATTPDGNGYWMVASDGGIFAFGDAKFFGSTGNIALVRPVVGMTTSPDGNGYWMVASDGGIFAFGDARFFGSTGNIVLNRPIVGMSSTSDGNGYWMVASDGGIFAFGDAQFYGAIA